MPPFVLLPITSLMQPCRSKKSCFFRSKVYTECIMNVKIGRFIAGAGAVLGGFALVQGAPAGSIPVITLGLELAQS